MTYRVRLSIWGRTDYEEAWENQEVLAAAVREGAEDRLVFVEHPPVYTFGRRVRPENLLAAPEALAERGARVVESDRGGDITFHGPGQVVAYPILSLRRRGIGPNDYVRGLEETLIRALAGFGIDAARSAGRPGVWVGGDKIAAIGVRLRGGVTTHGFALNVTTDLSFFKAIVPCGISGAGVTSIERESRAAPDIEAVHDALLAAFGDVFESELVDGEGPSQTALRSSREAAMAHGR